MLYEVITENLPGPSESTMPRQERETTVRVKGLNLFYDEVQALKNINLEIPDRQVTAFIGPSGCGKSTLSYNFV